MHSALLAHIKRYVNLTTAEEQLLCDSVELKKYKKKEFLLKAGKYCTDNYFVVKGCVRLYYVNDKLNEQIIQFGIENWWIADQDSLLNKKPSACFLQVLEPSELLVLPEKQREILCEQIPKLERYFFIMSQKAFVAAQRRIGFIFNLSYEERYRFFSKQYPGFIQRVPQYMLASYLGFTPQFLSRLRAKKV
jgi:CRP-like cAMP-binding protein